MIPYYGNLYILWGHGTRNTNAFLSNTVIDYLSILQIDVEPPQVFIVSIYILSVLLLLGDKRQKLTQASKADKLIYQDRK